MQSRSWLNTTTTSCIQAFKFEHITLQAQIKLHVLGFLYLLVLLRFKSYLKLAEKKISIYLDFLCLFL